MKTTIFFIAALIFSITQPSFAQIINVSNNAELTEANASAVAGNTVVIAAGIYTVTIKPTNSGTAANRIIYRAANGENVVITNKNNLLDLSGGQDFITIENITFREPRGNNSRFLFANGADNIVLDGCRFMDDENAFATFTSSYITNGKDWEIKNSYWDMSNIAIELIPGVNFKNQDGLVIDNSERFYIHNNEFGDILHTSLAVRYNNRDFKISNNLFTNGWRHGIAVTPGTEGTANEPQRILIENNTFLNIGARSNTNPRPPDRPRPTKSIGLQSSRVIIRANVFDNNISPIQVFSQTNRRITQNWIYHNTMNGSIKPSWVTRGLPGTSIHSQVYGSVTYNYILNNILFGAEKNDIDFTNQGGPTPTNNQISNNIISDQAGNISVRWYQSNIHTSLSNLESSVSQFSNNSIGNPEFVNASNGNFNINTSSAAKDNAKFLATINGKSGNQLTLGLNQGYAFWDGGGIAGQTGDMIYDDNGNSARVISVDAHNKITVANATVFSVGAELTVVNYSGTAPDIGAFEFIEKDTSLDIIERGSSWKYLDNGSNQGTAWQALGFDDSAWESGAAQLGYGDGDEATVVSFGPNASSKYTTTYFRHTFNLADASQITALNLELLRDDGAVVYLNGTEIIRSNMPQNGAISYTTLATAAVSGAGESTYFTSAIPPALLVTGTNTLAVEVHQYTNSSSDISFDAALTTTLPLIFTDSFE